MESLGTEARGGLDSDSRRRREELLIRRETGGGTLLLTTKVSQVIIHKRDLT